MSESEAKKNRKERDKDVKKEEGGRKEGMARRQVVKKVGKKDVEKDREDRIPGMMRGKVVLIRKIGDQMNNRAVKKEYRG